jgi:heme A synthase
MKLGQHWAAVGPWFHRFDTVIVILLVIGAAALLYNRIRSIRSAPQPSR